MMDGRESVRFRAFSRRTAILSAGTLGLFTLLTGRMFQLSVLQGDQFATLAEDNRINLRLVAPRRGRVYDRVGVELANTAQNFRVLLVPEQTKDAAATLERLAGLITLSPERVKRVIRDVRRGTSREVSTVIALRWRAVRAKPRRRKVAWYAGA